MTAPLPPDELARLSKLLALLDSDISPKQRHALNEIAHRVLRRALSQFLLDFLEFRPHAVASGFPVEQEAATA